MSCIIRFTSRLSSPTPSPFHHQDDLPTQTQVTVGLENVSLKIKTAIPAPSGEEKGGGGLMGLIRRGSSYLRRREAEEQQQRQEEERKEDLEIARSMFAAARRESYYAHRAD
ncbi:hypothetical protein TSMEX_002552 [Taenia solium]|eukprot:TsM_000783300 transcript=TsM_000783300 gene=TsM_000783300